MGCRIWLAHASIASINDQLGLLDGGGVCALVQQMVLFDQSRYPGESKKKSRLEYMLVGVKWAIPPLCLTRYEDGQRLMNLKVICCIQFLVRSCSIRWELGQENKNTWRIPWIWLRTKCFPSLYR